MRTVLALTVLGLLRCTDAAVVSKTLRQAGHIGPHLLKAHDDINAEFDQFLEIWFDDFMARKPMEALRFGRQLPVCQGLSKKADQSVSHIWGDASAAAEADGVQKDEEKLQEMRKRFGATIGARDLSDERHVSFILMQEKVKEMSQEHKYRAFRPPFGPLGCQLGVMGCQVQTAGMIKGLDISTLDDAKCYIALMNGLPDFLLAHGQRVQEASDQGATPYRLILNAVVRDCDAKLPSDSEAASKEEGTSARSNEMFKAFEGKLQKAKAISKQEAQTLLQDAEQSIVKGVWPAYRGLRKIATALMSKAPDTEKGIASTHGSKARDFYDYRVQLLGIGGDASSLHAGGVKQVSANVDEIKRDAVVVLPGFNASSPQLVMSALRKPYADARYEDTEAGRDLYLKDVQGYIDVMWKKLRQSADGKDGPRLFFHADIPTMECPVKRVESKSFPGLAQYSPGTVGKVNRSAQVGFNVRDMSRLSTMDMDILAYHEVVPGHHLQVTKTLTLPLPSFRRYFGDEAFAEGWAVYAEQDLSPRLVKLSPQSELGRLNRLQTLAVRMAVDTGLHALNWNRKKAEAFYIDYTMVTPERATQAVDRHFAWPAQAITYAAGHQGLKSVRKAVSDEPGLVKALGKDWEAMMHKAILSHGDLPLAMLQEVVFAQLNDWRPAAPAKSQARPHMFSKAVLLALLSSIYLLLA